MGKRFFAKRTIAALLAFILALTSMNFDYAKAYADDLGGGEKTQDLWKYVMNTILSLSLKRTEGLQY